MKHTLFRFRQDLRIIDNLGWIQSIQNSQTIIPVFIFDNDIISQFPTGDNRLSFVIDAVRDLENKLKSYGHTLIVYYGSACQIIPDLLLQYSCDTLAHCRSYGGGSLTRDQYISHRCLQHHIYYKTYDDYLLVKPSVIPARKVFTPFFRLWSQNPKIPISDYQKFDHKIKKNLTICHSRPDIQSTLGYQKNTHWPIDGWKHRLYQNGSDYSVTRNNLDIDGSTKLSVYIRFGLVSIRQVYRHHIIQNNPGSQLIISQLARREFWHHIMYHFPQARMVSFQENKRNIKRENNLTRLEAWKNGQTGYPIIDASMIQLRQEHWMHNRARMIVASFLTKDLLIDWAYGEQHFADYLLDYDSCVNIGNRQRAASVGADPRPLRIFSPILQAQKFDPQALYIKKYLPQLSHIEPKHLHDPLTYDLDYIKPIVDHRDMRQKAIQMYNHR